MLRETGSWKLLVLLVERIYRLNIDDDTYELNCKKESRDVFKIDLFTKILLRVIERAAD